MIVVEPIALKIALLQRRRCRRPEAMPEDALLKITRRLGIGTGTVQRVLMEQPRPFDDDVAEAALACQ